MDILRNKPRSEKEDKLEDFFFKKDDDLESESEAEEGLPSGSSGKIIARWQAPEFEAYERDKRWYAYAALILIAIISYAVYTNSPVSAIVFILIGAVGYIYLNKEPKIIKFSLTDTGIIAGREIYEFEQLHSFWIFYDPPQEKLISFHTKSYLLPFVHIPLDREDPVKMRQILLKYIPEVKQKPSFVDMLERLLRI